MFAKRQTLVHRREMWGQSFRPVFFHNLFHRLWGRENKAF